MQIKWRVAPMLGFWSNSSQSLFSCLLAVFSRFAAGLALCLFASNAWAACIGGSPTWTTTPDSASVSTCISNAAAGDTIKVSAGSAVWSSTIVITKGINLIGAGQGSTIITNNVAASDGAILIEVRNTGNNFVRISGFTFNNADNQTPIISLVGPMYQARVDHITFNKGDSAVGTNHYDSIVRGTGPVYGVVDHCSFINMKRPYYATDVRVGDSLFGTAAWNEFLANPSSFPGSNKIMYFEDNQFIWNSSLTDSNAQGALYGGYGGKACLRHNTFSGFQTYVDAHGDTPDYGTIYYELYNNVFSESDAFGGAVNIVGMRGGQLIAHDNTFTGSTKPFGMTVYWPTDLVTHRVQNTYYWNNSWNGATSQANLAYVYDTPTNPGGSTCSTTGCIRLNNEYFLNAPQSGQTYYPYTPYTYPHPLTNSSGAKIAAPTGLISTVN